MQTAASNPIRRRKIAAVTACVLVALIALSGTLAAVLLDQFDTNIFGGRGLRYDATLNEEFLEADDWQAGQTLDKPITVTNTGLNDGKFGEVFVRVQLKEFMELYEIEYKYWDVEGNKVTVPGGNPALFMTYTTDNGVTGEPGIEDEDHQAHIIINAAEGASDTAVKSAAAAQYPGLVALDPEIFENRKFVYLTDAVSGKSGWFVQTREGDINGQYGKWVVAEYARKDDSATSVDPLTMFAEGHDHGNYDQSGAAPSECDYTPHIMAAGMNGSERTALYREWITWNFGDNVQLLSDWNSKDQCWLFDDMTDDGNGWFYWSHPLTPDEAHATLQKTTDLLLESVTLIKQPEGEFYYAIHVDMESVSLADIWDDTPGKIKGTDPWQEPAPPAVAAPGNIINNLPGNATVNTPYTGTIAVEGGKPITWRVSEGELPAGLTLNSKTGTISGTPTTEGTYNFTLEASNDGGSKEYPITIVVGAARVLPNITTSSLAAAKVGTAYSATLQAESDTALTWSVSAGALPPGLRLDADTGVISGTPTGENQTYTFTVKASNGTAAEDATKELSIEVTTNKLATKTPPEGPYGFIPNIDTENPEYCDSTVAGYEEGVEVYHLRFSTIALESILKDASDVPGVTVEAVDTALKPYIKIANNFWASHSWGDNKRSVMCDWSFFTAADLATLNSDITSVSYASDNTPIITTDITLTNSAGTQSATVTVSFYFTHSLFL